MQAPKKTSPIKEALKTKTELNGASPAPPPLDNAAIEQGRKPLNPRRKDAAAIRAKALELYGIPAGGSAPIPAIDSQFKFSPLASDQNFHSLHVEALLARAASHLQRCAAERARRDLLLAERWKMQLELDAFFRLETLHARERQAGLDTLPYERATIEGAAEKSLEENHRGAALQRQALIEELMASGFNKRMGARELAAWVSAYPLKDQQLTGDDASYVFDGAKRSKPDHLFEAARIDADLAAWEQASTLMAQRYASAAASESAHWRKAGFDLQARWAQADITFRGERAQAAQDAMWETAFQAQSPGGLLNANEKIAAAEHRFALDFRDALSCLAAGRRGLKDVYDYAPPFPAEGSAAYFEQVEQWLKTAQDQLEQFAQLDQQYVLAASLKQLSKGAWESGRASAEWTFDIPEELFQNQANVRLRGIGLAVTGRKPDPLEAAPKPAAKAQAQKVDLPKPEPPKPEGFGGRASHSPPGAACAICRARRAK
jgi:hypothetical protein